MTSNHEVDLGIPSFEIEVGFRRRLLFKYRDFLLLSTLFLNPIYRIDDLLERTTDLIGLDYLVQQFKGVVDDDLVNFTLKELRCSTQCHMPEDGWIYFKRFTSPSGHSNSRQNTRTTNTSPIWRIQFSVQYIVFTQQINMAYPLPLDTAYRSSGTETEFLEVLIRASRLKKVMANKGKKSSMETLVPNDKADYYFGITNITVNRKNAYEVKGKFLDDMHNKAFSGTNGKDTVEHIEYYLKIIDLIKLPNVDHDKHRIVVFLISLAEGTRRWFDRTKESITCWVDLTAKFFGKYYPPSRIEGNNTPVIIWDPSNPRFEGWLAKKFVNYKTMDIFTKGALWDYWKMGSNEIEVSDNESSDLEECWSDKEETAKKI
ncbi:hypothetical protein Tco_0378386 [Tanacetum coccineum]